MRRRGEPSSDCELLDAWRAGDAAAGDALLARYYTGLFRFFEVRDPSAADDLTQRTLMLCVEQRDRFAERGTFRAHLFGIAWRQLMRYRRGTSQQRQRVSFDEESVEARPGVSLTTLLHRRKEHQLLLCAIEALPLELQAAVGLFYWEGLPATELSEVFQVTPSAMRTRLARARELLRAEIESMSGRGTTREALLADLDGWARSATDGIELAPPSIASLGRKG